MKPRRLSPAPAKRFLENRTSGRTMKRSLFRLSFLPFLCLPFLSTLTTATPASADLRLCNKTGAQVGIAIGYKGEEDWVSEGWWNIDAETCEIVVEGPLPSRYYYVYALDYQQGGEWAGTAYMCTREKEFTITGTQDCMARGYERTGFIEIDTGDQASWTVHLTERSKTGIGGR